MIIDVDAASGSLPAHRPTQTGAGFDAMLAQCIPTPLFAPWPVADQNVPTPLPANNAKLNPHPATSNRREGRHARG